MAKQQPASSDSSGQCVLCRNTSFRYSRAANVGKQKRCIIDRFTSTSSLPDTACIYQACIMQVKHNIKNEHFHPRWLPKQNKTEQNKAAVLNTAKTLFTGTLTSSVMRKWQKLVFTVESNCAQVPLCQSHYNDMYTKAHTSNPCDSCRMKPRKGELFGRHCPAPDNLPKYHQ